MPIHHVVNSYLTIDFMLNLMPNEKGGKKWLKNVHVERKGYTSKLLGLLAFNCRKSTRAPHNCSGITHVCEEVHVVIFAFKLYLTMGNI